MMVIPFQIHLFGLWLDVICCLGNEYLTLLACQMTLIELLVALVFIGAVVSVILGFIIGIRLALTIFLGELVFFFIVFPLMFLVQLFLDDLHRKKAVPFVAGIIRRHKRLFWAGLCIAIIVLLALAFYELY